MRIGHGYDIHRLQKGGKLVLAGVLVSDELSPIAHSDGDVVLHAVVDALLGAIGAGDIGEMYPNSDPRWKNANSKVFVEGAMQEIRRHKLHVANLDVTILAEHPKLKGFKRKMKDSLSSMVSAEVNIKAGTNEGCDAIGRGEAIAAHAIVLLAGENRAL